MWHQTANHVGVHIAGTLPCVFTADTKKVFRILPIMGKKTKAIIENRKFFCDNPDCTIATFAERFDFLEQNGKKTKRLIDKIIEDISLNTSSVTASRTLKDGIAEVGKSTICNILKKRDTAP